MQHKMDHYLVIILMHCKLTRTEQNLSLFLSGTNVYNDMRNDLQTSQTNKYKSSQNQTKKYFNHTCTFNENEWEVVILQYLCKSSSVQLKTMFEGQSALILVNSSDPNIQLLRLICCASELQTMVYKATTHDRMQLIS